MKYLKTTVLSCSETKTNTDKGLYRADIQITTRKKLQSGVIVENLEILTISSTEKLQAGEQFLRILSEYNINNKIYITVDQSSQKLEIIKKG